MKKEINFKNLVKIIKQSEFKDSKRIVKILRWLTFISAIELVSLLFMFIWITSWWISFLIGFIIWTILINYNLNAFYILYITVFKDDQLMMSMVEDSEY